MNDDQIHHHYKSIKNTKKIVIHKVAEIFPTRYTVFYEASVS